MPSYSVNDQATLERLVKRVRGRFRFVPAWGFWLECREGVWHPAGAEENLKTEYLLSLEEVDSGEPLSRRDLNQRLHSFSFSAQSYVLALARKEERLLASPEWFESPGGFPLYRPIAKEAHDWGLSLAWKAAFGVVADSEPFVAKISRYMHDAVLSATILLRRSNRFDDLYRLHDPLLPILGERVARLGVRTWATFPDSLDHGLAWRLTGIRALFLDAPERWQKFPDAALFRWALTGAEQWRGKDGQRYSLPLPRLIVLTGPPVHFENIRTEIKTLCVALEDLSE